MYPNQLTPALDDVNENMRLNTCGILYIGSSQLLGNNHCNKLVPWLYEALAVSLSGLLMGSKSRAEAEPMCQLLQKRAQRGKRTTIRLYYCRVNAEEGRGPTESCAVYSYQAAFNMTGRKPGSRVDGAAGAAWLYWIGFDSEVVDAVYNNKSTQNLTADQRGESTSMRPSHV
jgi:hypothetical protein